MSNKYEHVPAPVSLVENQNAPNQATIDCLETMLAQAKTGELRTIVAICGWSADKWSNMWSIDRRNSRRKLLGESAMMHYDLLTKQALEDGDSVLAGSLI